MRYGRANRQYAFSASLIEMVGNDISDESRTINALIFASIEHGLDSSAFISRLTIGAAPEAFQGAMGAGVLAIRDRHGGAIEKCAKVPQEGVD